MAVVELFNSEEMLAVATQLLVLPHHSIELSTAVGKSHVTCHITCHSSGTPLSVYVHVNIPHYITCHVTYVTCHVACTCMLCTPHMHVPSSTAATDSG